MCMWLALCFLVDKRLGHFCFFLPFSFCPSILPSLFFAIKSPLQNFIFVHLVNSDGSLQRVAGGMLVIGSMLFRVKFYKREMG